MTTEYNQIDTGFFEDGVDIGTKYVTKSYLIDVYPYLTPGVISAPGLFVWGYNSSGQLGTNDTVHRSSPIQVYGGGTNWKIVSCEYAHTTAIKTDGTLWTWGDNRYGQLGTNDRTHRSSPVQTVAGGTNWKIVFCGYYHTAAIKTDGTLWTWGYNYDGQLGTNNIIHRSSPVQTVAGGTNWKSVSSGYINTAAIKTDGTLWIWGYNGDGQLGNNNVTHRSSPVQTVAGGTNWKIVSAGGGHTAAIKTDGTLWVWGINEVGQLGTNNTVHRSSPVQTVAGGTNWKTVSAGSYQTAAIKTDGTLWTCGYNSYGQLGTNDIIHRSSPVQTVAGGTNWKTVSASGYQTAAIKIDGTLWIWGLNSGYGNLGTNDINDRSSPVQTVAGGTNWKSIGLGHFSSTAIAEVGDDF